MISAITLVLSLPFLLLGEMVPKRIGDEILAVAFIFSILFTISTTSLWWFGSTSLLPESLRAHFFPPKVQFPMGNLNGITVDKKGYIYLGVPGYSRIQQYNSEGDFLKGWFINAGGGVFNVWADHSDNIHVRTARTDAHLIFNEDGQLLKTTKIASLEEDEYLAQQASGLRAKDALGNTYSIENLKWSPKVVKINPKGKESILIKDPAYFSLFRHPQPLFSVAFAGLIMSAIIGIIVKFKIHFPEKYRRKPVRTSY
jgi:hypothetical protein